VAEGSRDSSPLGGAAGASDLQALASRLQHQLNNPLAALLAEAQMLGMEPDLSAERRADVERIVLLVRRMISTVRALDDAEKVLGGPVRAAAGRQ